MSLLLSAVCLFSIHLWQTEPSLRQCASQIPENLITQPQFGTADSEIL